MIISKNKLELIKRHIEDHLIGHLKSYARMTYPNECCGFLLTNGAIFPAHNVIESLCDPTLTSKNAFLIDQVSWEHANEVGIAGIYHSHTNGISDMSDADINTLRWKNLYYVIIALQDNKIVSSKLFWWDEKLNSTTLEIR